MKNQKRNFVIRIVGAKPPKRHGNPLKRLYGHIRGAADVVLLRPRAAMLVGLTAFVLFIGTPHVGWDYGCSHATRGFGACRSASWCAYYGIQGRRVERPGSGETCKLVTFLPLDWGKLLDGVLG